MKKINFNNITEKIARTFIYMFFMFSSFLAVVSCSSEEVAGSQETNVVDSNFRSISDNYLPYSDALLISNQLIDAVKSFSEQTIDKSTTNEIELDHDFWLDNQSVLNNVSGKAGFENNIITENVYQFNEEVVNVNKINSADFLTPLQKTYAINLLNASEQNDFDELISIKNNFKNDVRDNPELELFNLGIAIIEVGESSFRVRNCNEAGIKSGIISGIVGLVGGAIIGGVSGVVVGLGILSIPAGGGGAMAGGIIGALSGFVTGYIKGYLSCLIFG